MTLATRIRDLTEQTVFIDTHEHLPDEELRLANGMARLGCGDWSVLLSHYCCYDLCTSGIDRAAFDRFYQEPDDPAAKYDLIAPHWNHVKNTGYGQAVRRTLSGLYGERDLTRESAPRIAERYEDLRRPGFYDEILRRRARIEVAQVNSKQSTIFWDTAHPTMLQQDIEITALCNPAMFGTVEAEFGVYAATLDDWLGFIDASFARFAPKAVAVKSVAAYSRGLDFAATDRRQAERIFRQWRQWGWMRDDERKGLEDFLFRWCLALAGEHGLPVKLHTGMNSFNDAFPIAPIANHASNLFSLVMDFPEVRFDLFHIGYPFQQQMIYLAKHHTNVYIDMCWAWILDPVACVSFLKSFITSVPNNKLFGFGGDYFPVEPVFGHAEMARHGIARAVYELVEEGWIVEEEAGEVITKVMRQNAIDFFGPPPSQQAAPPDIAGSSDGP